MRRDLKGNITPFTIYAEWNILLSVSIVFLNIMRFVRCNRQVIEYYPSVASKQIFVLLWDIYIAYRFKT